LQPWLDLDELRIESFVAKKPALLRYEKINGGDTTAGVGEQNVL
jgi:hypothetical protein